MSSTNRSQVDVGCPECNATISASMPTPTAAAVLDWDDPNRLQGTERRCRECGHELAFYYY